MLLTPAVKHPSRSRSVQRVVTEQDVHSARRRPVPALSPTSTVGDDTLADARADYGERGYRLVSGIFQPADFSALKREFLAVTEALTGRHFASMHDRALCDLLRHDLPLESQVYDATKGLPALHALAFHPSLTAEVSTLIRRPFGVFAKAVLRIDLPGVEAEVAHWHQDSFFVGGGGNVITAWIPLQDVNTQNGCLEIAPGSQKLGPVDHPRQVGKRMCPTEEVLATVERQEVPMAFGGALLFHAYLLHAGRLNRSEGTRYSLQYRYAPLGDEPATGMGDLLPVSA